MEESQEEISTTKQGKIRDYAELKPWQFKPGQSGNPSGKPKGTVSLKEFAKRYIQELTDEEKLEFMNGLDKNEVWRMAEGNPKNDMELSGKISIANVLEDIENGNSKQIIRQTMADISAIQNTKQTERASNIPPQQSPEALPSPQVEQKYNPEV